MRKTRADESFVKSGGERRSERTGQALSVPVGRVQIPQLCEERACLLERSRLGDRQRSACFVAANRPANLLSCIGAEVCEGVAAACAQAIERDAKGRLRVARNEVEP